MAIEATDMVPIPLKEFLAGTVVPVDLFIRLSGDKFILIAKEDSKTQVEQLKTYESKQVEYLFVRRDDYNRYVDTNIAIAEIMLTRTELSSGRKADFLVRAGGAVLKEIEFLGLNHDTYEHARLVAHATSLLVESKPDIYSVLKSLSTISDDLVAHAVAVSAISVMIGRAQGWTKRATFEKLSLGALFHDVGLKELPPDVLCKPRAELSFDEIQLFETHPFRGLELLRTMPSIPDDIMSIVYEHHENAIGQGYPRKVRDLRMNPLARVVALADQFVDLTIKSTNCPNPKSADEAIKFIEFTMGQPFNKDAFAALKALCNPRLAGTAAGGAVGSAA